MAKIMVVSFGRKYGTPREWGDHVSCLDLPNPHREHHLRPLTGLDERVQEYVLSSPGFNEVMLEAEARVPKGRASSVAVTVVFACLGGRHRSVAVAELFSREMRDAGHQVTVVHRDVDNSVHRSNKC